MSARIGYVRCTVCDRSKAPIGRSVPLEMAAGMCDASCLGYYRKPMPDCRWPGEWQCGPGCTYEPEPKDREVAER